MFIRNKILFRWKLELLYSSCRLFFLPLFGASSGVPCACFPLLSNLLAIGSSYCPASVFPVAAFMLERKRAGNENIDRRG